MVDADRRDPRLSLFEQERIQAKQGSGKTGLVSMVGGANNQHPRPRRNSPVTKAVGRFRSNSRRRVILLPSGSWRVTRHGRPRQPAGLHLHRPVPSICSCALPPPTAKSVRRDHHAIRSPRRNIQVGPRSCRWLPWDICGGPTMQARSSECHRKRRGHSLAVRLPLIFCGTPG